MAKRSYLLGLFHLSVDFLSLAPLTLLIVGSEYGIDSVEIAIIYFLYLAFAFLFQAPLGAIMDRRGKGDGRKAAWLSVPLLLLGGLLVSLPSLSVLLPPWGGEAGLKLTVHLLGTMVLGAGNALFHVGAGRHLLTLGAGPSELGAFISFGTIAVCLTSIPFVLLTRIVEFLLPILYLLFGIFAISLSVWLFLADPKPSEKRISSLETPSFSGNLAELAYLALFIGLSVFLRGFLGGYKESSEGIVYLLAMLGMFLGKLLGGYLEKYLGSLSLVILSGATYVLGILLPSHGGMVPAFFLAFGTNLPMGLTLSLSGRAFGKGKEGLAFGFLSTLLGFGTGLGAYLAPLGTDSRISQGLMMLNLVFLLLSLLLIGKGNMRRELFPSFRGRNSPKRYDSKEDLL